MRAIKTQNLSAVDFRGLSHNLCWPLRLCGSSVLCADVFQFLRAKNARNRNDTKVRDTSFSDSDLSLQMRYVIDWRMIGKWFGGVCKKLLPIKVEQCRPISLEAVACDCVVVRVY